MTRLHTYAVLCVLVLAIPAQAQTTTPTRKTEALNALQSRIESEKAEQAALKKKMAAAEEELEKTQKSLIDLTADLQKNEKTLTALEVRIQKSRAERDALRKRIERDYGSMSDLVLALQRIRRIPPETLVIRPGAPLEAAQSAMLLGGILPGLKDRAAAMSNDLTEIQRLEKTLEADQAAAIKTAADLKTRQKDLQVMLDKREALYRKTRSSYEIHAERIARMASEAENLQQLVSRIEIEEKKAKQTATTKPAKTPRTKTRLPGGTWTTPVQGMVQVRFGEHDAIGAQSEGLTISGRAGALVSAPAAGTIRFAGPFRNYGNMVIIEHQDGLHSLMSGLGQIHVDVGRSISAGEPVGTLSGTGAGGPARLYYELRLNGKAVDPSAKFPELSS